jgi:hypothetical protein
LPPLGQAGRGQYEGFAYLGAGAIAALGGAVLLSAGSRLRAPGVPVGLTPLIVVAAAMFVFALSTRVTFGARVLVETGLPQSWLEAVSVFRATGRFVWPLALLLVVWACARLGRDLPGRGAAVLMLALVAFQTWDLSGKWAEFGRRFAAGGIGGMPDLSEPGWAAALGREHLVVLPARIDRQWIAPALFAARHGMTINLSRVARGDPQALARAEALALAQLRAGEPRPDTAYWIRDPALEASLPVALDAVASKHPLGDGILIVARPLR